MVERVPGWPGVGLSDKEMRATPHETWEPRIRYDFSAGEAMSRFLEELRVGRFVARHCRRCDTLLFPPRMFCEECYAPTESWVPIRDTGTIETFSVSYLDRDANRIEKPVFVGVVMLDGPDYRAREKGRDRMGMMHYFGDISAKKGTPYGYDIRVGMRVKAVWKPASERTGSVLDVVHFRPLKPDEEPFPGGEA